MKIPGLYHENKQSSNLGSLKQRFFFFSFLFFLIRMSIAGWLEYLLHLIVLYTLRIRPTEQPLSVTVTVWLRRNPLYSFTSVNNTLLRSDVYFFTNAIPNLNKCQAVHKSTTFKEVGEVEYLAASLSREIDTLNKS